jgi:hypothetical protein
MSPRPFFWETGNPSDAGERESRDLDVPFFIGFQRIVHKHTAASGLNGFNPAIFVLADWCVLSGRAFLQTVQLPGCQTTVSARF